MRVLFVLAGDETRASTRFRVLELLPYLNEAGIQTSHLSLVHFAKRDYIPKVIGYLLSISLLTMRAPRYDGVYLQKAPLPGWYLRFLSLFGCDVVYDFDDAIYLTRPGESEQRLWQRFLDGCLSSATVVIAGSPVLGEYAKQHADRVKCLPTAIPEPEYSSRRGRGDARLTRLVWIGYPENLRYLETVTEPIAEVLEEHEEARLRVITAGELPIEPLRERSDVEYCEWTLEGALDRLAEGDIGIRPLIDDEWTRAKGGFTSVVEMMALGLPVIVTPVGSLDKFVEDGVSGFHAETHEHWKTSLRTLIRDKSRREEMGENAIRAVDEWEFWTEDRADDLIEVLDLSIE